MRWPRPTRSWPDYQSAVFALSADHIRPDAERARRFIQSARSLLSARGLV